MACRNVHCLHCAVTAEFYDFFAEYIKKNLTFIRRGYVPAMLVHSSNTCCIIKIFASFFMYITFTHFKIQWSKKKMFWLWATKLFVLFYADMGATPFSEQDLFLNLNFFQRSYRLFYWPKAYYFFKRAKTNKIQFIN